MVLEVGQGLVDMGRQYPAQVGLRAQQEVLHSFLYVRAGHGVIDHRDWGTTVSCSIGDRTAQVTSQHLLMAEQEHPQQVYQLLPAQPPLRSIRGVRGQRAVLQEVQQQAQGHMEGGPLGTALL